MTEKHKRHRTMRQIENIPPEKPADASLLRRLSEILDGSAEETAFHVKTETK